MVPVAQLCNRRYRKSGATKIGNNSVPGLKTVKIGDKKRLKETMQAIFFFMKYQDV